MLKPAPCWKVLLRPMVVSGVSLSAILTFVHAADAVLPVPTDCAIDAGGANDAVGQSDLTKYCANLGDGSPYELHTISNIDVTSLSGGNTADVCQLFNTDGDAFADLAVCVSAQGTGVDDALELSTLALYTCTDTKADRCTGPTLITQPPTYTTQCEVSQQGDDPFPGPAPGPGDDYPDDTRVLCALNREDFGVLAIGAVPLDTCSYPSGSVNSNPSDCIVFGVCAVNADCDDANPCTLDTCDPTLVCKHAPLPGSA
jgi:hypothetical protein